MRWCASYFENFHLRHIQRVLARFAAVCITAIKPPLVRVGALVLSIFWLIPLPIESAAVPSQHHTSSSNHNSPSISQHDTSHKKMTREERLRQAEHDLHNAQNNAVSQRAWKRAERLRQRGLSAGNQLILTDASEQTQKGFIELAEHRLSNALTLQPDNALIRRQRAGIRLLGNDPFGAVQDLGLSLNADPRDPTAWMLLAEAQEKLHHNDLALHAFKQAMSCAPFLPDKDTKLKHYTELAHGRED